MSGCILAICVTAGTAVPLKDKCVITMVKQIEISGEDLLLGDCTRVEGKNAEFVQQLKGINIGKAPLPARSRRLDRNYIILRLRQNDVDMDYIDINGTLETEIVRGYQQLSKEDIETLVTAELPAIVGLDEDKMAIRKTSASHGIILPKGKYQYEVIPPKHTDFLGNVLMSVVFSFEDGFRKRVYATADIEQFADVVVVKWPLRRNHIIKENDIEIRRMSLNNLPSNSLTDPIQAVGNKVRRHLDKDTVLYADLIDIPPLIQKKDVVLMVAETPQFKIITLGESKEIGFKGDLIRVRNLESDNEVYARVLDAKSVKVEF